jgi:hypothetical protein
MTWNLDELSLRHNVAACPGHNNGLARGYGSDSFTDQRCASGSVAIGL